MAKIKLLVILLYLCCSCKQGESVETKTSTSATIEPTSQQIQVLTLGTFHFDFPNLDLAKIDNSSQIDVLDPHYQKEIITIVNRLAAFKPTKIVIERQPKKQEKYDSLYNAFLAGNYDLNRSEEQQLGFRLAKTLGLKKLYCVDAWGNDYEEIKKVMYGDDTISKNNFMEFFYHNPDSILFSFKNDKRIFKTEGITAELKRLNSEEQLKRGLGDYLIGIFKYETDDNSQFGPDYVTSWWFNRNLRIFRNIQRIDTDVDDRIVVIYGAGHMNLLNIFFESSPEYKLVDVNDYLN